MAVYGNAFRGHTISVTGILPKADINTLVTGKVGEKHLVSGTDRITKIIMVGHGGYDKGGILGGLWQNSDETSDFTTAKMKNPQSAHAKLLAYLKPWTDGHSEVELRACNEARGPEGKEFMLVMSQALGARVIGYDDYYAVKDWGDQYTASPDGSFKMTKKGRPFKGSWADMDSWSALWDGFSGAANFFAF